jgi:hypothetical protein
MLRRSKPWRERELIELYDEAGFLAESKSIAGRRQRAATQGVPLRKAVSFAVLLLASGCMDSFEIQIRNNTGNFIKVEGIYLKESIIGPNEVLDYELKNIDSAPVFRFNVNNINRYYVFYDNDRWFGITHEVKIEINEGEIINQVSRTRPLVEVKSEEYGRYAREYVSDYAKE